MSFIQILRSYRVLAVTVYGLARKYANEEIIFIAITSQNGENERRKMSGVGNVEQSVNCFQFNWRFTYPLICIHFKCSLHVSHLVCDKCLFPWCLYFFSILIYCRYVAWCCFSAAWKRKIFFLLYCIQVMFSIIIVYIRYLSFCLKCQL